MDIVFILSAYAPHGAERFLVMAYGSNNTAAARTSTARPAAGNNFGRPPAVLSHSMILRTPTGDVKLTGFFRDQGKNFSKVGLSEDVQKAILEAPANSILVLTGIGEKSPLDGIDSGESHSLSFRKKGAGAGEKGMNILRFSRAAGSDETMAVLDPTVLTKFRKMAVGDKFYLFTQTPK